jgi:hypothetical protein
MRGHLSFPEICKIWAGYFRGGALKDILDEEQQSQLYQVVAQRHFSSWEILISSVHWKGPSDNRATRTPRLVGIETLHPQIVAKHLKHLICAQKQEVKQSQKNFIWNWKMVKLGKRWVKAGNKELNRSIRPKSVRWYILRVAWGCWELLFNFQVRHIKGGKCRGYAGTLANLTCTEGKDLS